MFQGEGSSRRDRQRRALSYAAAAPVADARRFDFVAGERPCRRPDPDTPVSGGRAAGHDGEGRVHGEVQVARQDLVARCESCRPERLGADSSDHSGGPGGRSGLDSVVRCRGGVTCVAVPAQQPGRISREGTEQPTRKVPAAAGSNKGRRCAGQKSKRESSRIPGCGEWHPAVGRRC